ncbi:MAG TPA: diguanylate cyclase [Mycobacteriales bacterium]|nr:diguanylate cyclase [Mycobacteriales bacterium]
MIPGDGEATGGSAEPPPAAALDVATVTQSLARHAAALDAIEEIALAPAQPSLLLELCVERARALVRGDGSAVELLEDDEELLFAATSGILRDQLGECQRVTGSLCGLAVRTGEAVHTHNAQTDERGDQEQAAALGIKAMITVPLLQDGKPFGVLLVCSRDEAVFAEEDALLLRRLARVVGARLDYTFAKDARKRSEQALNASRTKYRSVLASIDQGILVVSGLDRVVMLNPAAERILGLPAYELVGSSPAEWLHRTDGSRWPADDWPVRKALDERRTVRDVLMRVTGADGNIRWLNTTTSPLPTREHGPGGAVMSISDVSERRRDAEQRQHIEGLLAATQRLAHVGSWDWRLADGTAISATWSDEMYRLLGLTPQFAPVTVELYLECIHPDDRADVLAAGRRAFTEGGQVHFGHRAVLPTGEVRNLQITGEVTVDLDGRPERAWGSALDVTERYRAQEELRRMALTDPLTGLGNRLQLVNRLREAMAWLAETSGSHVAVIAVDLDGLKSVNDTYGHATGDELLQETGHRLRRTARKGDTVARLGGDEFVVVCPGLQPGAAAALAEHVVTALSAPYQLKNNVTAWSGASVGVTLTEDPYSDPDKLLAEADRALYAAKGGGGNRYAVDTDAFRRAASA